MNIDFSFLLVLASIATGAIWGGYLLWMKLRGKTAETSREPILVEYARSFFPVIFIVLLLRSFLVEPFRIPSGSMMPTLLIGDFILVNKFVYGIRLPVVHTKIFALEEPRRGDIVVFRFPKDPSVDYIKRVIGLPGDRIGYHDKQLFVNGERVNSTALGVYQGKGKSETMNGALALSEDLDTLSHDILIRLEQPSMQGDFSVPEGRYFVMGDNRDNSNDSRYWGTVPEENLVGKAFLIWMNWDLDNGGIAWNRLGTLVK